MWDGPVLISPLMVEYIVKSAMIQGKFTLEIRICILQDNTILTGNTGHSVLYMLRIGQENRVKHLGLARVTLVRIQEIHRILTSRRLISVKAVVLKGMVVLVTLIGGLLPEDFLLLGIKKIIGTVRDVGVENIGLMVSGNTEKMVRCGLNLNFHNL